MCNWPVICATENYPYFACAGLSAGDPDAGDAGGATEGEPLSAAPPQQLGVQSDGSAAAAAAERAHRPAAAAAALLAPAAAVHLTGRCRRRVRSSTHRHRCRHCRRFVPRLLRQRRRQRSGGPVTAQRRRPRWRAERPSADHGGRSESVLDADPVAAQQRVHVAGESDRAGRLSHGPPANCA